ncbi:MAG: hypothetical protein CVV47_16475 [Spirochaetae bacterium HGW-Spirochaetae-3]|jgi:parvulin-like peptidyl-prolyl isomerase|nr:MAG: hypothetical protein CVV47_16475 [Spirochaetae bacterium HGW-Spirochaetae-3]
MEEGIAIVPPISDEDAILRKKRKYARRVRTIAILGSLSVLIVVVVQFRESIFRPRPPSPEIAATFTGGQITVADIRAHFDLLAGGSGADKPQLTFKTAKAVAQEMITDEILRKWGKSRKADKDENIGHLMSHVNEEVNLSAWHSGMHDGSMGINESDIDAYYRANRQAYGEKTLGEVRGEIEKILKAQGEDRFVENFLAGLKNTADIRRNYDALNVPDLEQSEILDYYERNRDRFTLPARFTADVIRIDLPGSDADIAASRIIEKARSGIKLVEAARKEGNSFFISEGEIFEKGTMEQAFEKRIIPLEVGQISEPFRHAGSTFIVSVSNRDGERKLGFDEAEPMARRAAALEKQNTWFTSNRDLALFSVGGKRLSLGEFWTEYGELPHDLAAKYAGSSGMAKLAEALLDRYLVAEEASRGGATASEGSVRAEEARLKLLAEMMEKEEIDDKVSVSEEEIAGYFKANKRKYVIPPQSKIRRIAIKLEESEEGRRAAWRRAEEAYTRLAPGLFRKPADFAEIAGQYDMAALEGSGWTGDAIWIGEGRDFLSEVRDHEFHEIVKKIPLGGIGKPFLLKDRIYIVQVVERSKPESIDIEEAKGAIREELTARKHEELGKAFSKRMLRENKAIIYDQVLRTLITDDQEKQKKTAE